MKHDILRRSLTALLMALLLCGASALAEEDLTLTFQLDSGFYREEQTLLITCSDPEADIYYTTDGSVPDDTDLYFDEWIDLTDTTQQEDPLSQITGTSAAENYIPPMDFPSAHVIRAIAITEDGRCSEVVSGTYFIGYDRAECYGDLPILSLMTEPDGLYDMDTGIYVLGSKFLEWDAEQTAPYEDWEIEANFTQRGREWERPVLVEFLTEDEGFCQEMGMRIKGGASRGNNQKSLRLIARDEYGQKNVKYPIFPDNLCEQDGEVLEKYKSFTLRNGGNDCDFAKIRDPIIRRLATGMNLEVSDTRPVIAFLNGEYWGLYTLTEEYTDNYFDYHYGIDNENVITIKTSAVQDGLEEDKDLYWSMVNYITGHDMTKAKYYEKAQTLLDLDSFADYLALNLYIYNEDGVFQNNNWQMWRVRDPEKEDHPLADGKWRMIVYDTDYSSGIYNDGSNFNTDNLTPVLFEDQAESWEPAGVAQALLKNPDFRQKLILALCDVRNQYFLTSRVIEAHNAMSADYLPYVPDTFRRFGPEWVTKWDPERHYQDKLNSVTTYFRGRYTAFPNILRQVFQLDSPTSVTIKNSDGTKGTVYLNGRTIPITTSLMTKYFSEYPITVTAVPAEGAKFVRWELSNDRTILSDPTALTTEITFDGNFTVTAIFE